MLTYKDMYYWFVTSAVSEKAVKEITENGVLFQVDTYWEKFEPGSLVKGEDLTKRVLRIRNNEYRSISQSEPTVYLIGLKYQGREDIPYGDTPSDLMITFEGDHGEDYYRVMSTGLELVCCSEHHRYNGATASVLDTFVVTHQEFVEMINRSETTDVEPIEIVELIEIDEDDVPF